MKTITFKEYPTKLKLKKAILKKVIIVMEKNTKSENDYVIIEPNIILDLWNIFDYCPKYYNPNDLAEATLGKSFYYRFFKKIS